MFLKLSLGFCLKLFDFKFVFLIWMTRVLLFKNTSFVILILSEKEIQDFFFSGIRSTADARDCCRVASSWRNRTVKNFNKGYFLWKSKPYFNRWLSIISNTTLAFAAHTRLVTHLSLPYKVIMPLVSCKPILSEVWARG